MLYGFQNYARARSVSSIRVNPWNYHKPMDINVNNIKSVFESAPFAVCAFDRSGTVIYVNKLLESNIEPSVLPFVGKSLYELVHKFLVDERLEKNLKRLIEKNKPFSVVVKH